MSKLFKELGSDITLIDTGMMGDEIVACYMIASGDQVAIIETGNFKTAQRILSVLADKGISPEQVRYVIVTHIHLDHAGGASTLIKDLPNAELLVHPSGYKHMVNPEQLIAGATQVYGEARFREMYGDIEAIPEDKVRAIENGETVMLGQRPLLFEDTPGHAYHHFCIWDEQDRCWFTGDTFGICYNGMKTSPTALLIPTTTPTQFNPDAMKASMSKLLSRIPKRMMLTHYGSLAIENHQAVEAFLHQQVDDIVALTLSKTGDDQDHQPLASRLMDYYRELVQNKNIKIPESELKTLLKMDLGLNAQGLFYWYKKYHA
jgi:glyoxylase-like metal-dependent hydrolase (beta-lactamase superfamily II)